MTPVGQQMTYCDVMPYYRIPKELHYPVYLPLQQLYHFSYKFNFNTKS
jgi:hypothetical protein